MPRIEWEHHEQVGLVNDLRDLLPKYPELAGLYAVPNESGKGTAAMIRSKKLKQEGVKVGVSDLVLPVPRIRQDADIFQYAIDLESGKLSDIPFYMGLYVEMKRAPSVSPVKKSISFHAPSKEQKEYLDFVRSQGYIGECCSGRLEALEVFKWYLNLERIPADDLQVDYSHVDFMRAAGSRQG